MLSLNDRLMTDRSQKHSSTNCYEDVIEDWQILLSYFVSNITVLLSGSSFLKKTILQVYVEAHKAWDFFCLLTGLKCKYRSPSLSKSPCLPRGRQSGTVPSFTRIWLPFVFRVKAIVSVSFKVCVFFSTSVPIPLCGSCLCVADAAHGFVTALNIERKRKRDSSRRLFLNL